MVKTTNAYNVEIAGRTRLSILDNGAGRATLISLDPEFYRAGNFIHFIESKGVKIRYDSIDDPNRIFRSDYILELENVQDCKELAECISKVC